MSHQKILVSEEYVGLVCCFQYVAIKSAGLRMSLIDKRLSAYGTKSYENAPVRL